MKNISNRIQKFFNQFFLFLSFLAILLIGGLFQSCEEEIEGCSDSSACNYNSEATIDDGTCCFPLEEIIEITHADYEVSGPVGEDVTADIHIKNASCDQVGIMVRKMTTDPAAYFCFAGSCYTSNITVSENPLIVQSCQEVDGDIDGDGFYDYFKGYFNSTEEGEYQVTYRFYLQDDLNTAVEVTITYIIS